MAKGSGTCLYKEARLNLEPAFPGSSISFTLPANTISTFGLRINPKRTFQNEQNIDHDEEAFAKRHLASDGSMFFRKHHEYPRSFIWRILDNRKTLEVQAADLDHDYAHRFEANLTLLFHFNSPVRPFCVAFAEPEDRDALNIFAITTANELYTITLPRDFFIKDSASEKDIGDWCKISALNQFALRVPYRLVAPSNKELLISLDDGGILYVTRKHKDDLEWTEAVYQHSTWSGSVRRMLPWKGNQTLRFENTDMDSSAAAALSLSPDAKHIFSTCLNHRLRAWNIATGRPGIQRDLLDEPDRANEKVAPYLIGPSQQSLMAIVNIPGGVDGALYHVVTYSPKQHQFKFWGIRDADDAELGIYDIHPEVEFVPPVDELMNTNVWTLEEFFVNPGPAGWRGAEIWIRSRSGPSSKVYTLKFDLTDDASKLTKAWKDGWVSVDAGSLTVDGLKQNPSNPSEQDVEAFEQYDSALAERWLEFLFYPGRFTVSTLETALLTYRKGLEQERSVHISAKGSLKERICTTIATFTASRSQESSSDDTEYDDVASAQWQVFYGLVRDLHKRRGEYLSLNFDFANDAPWLVLSDYLSAVRQCSETEIIALNAHALADTKPPSGPLRRAIARPEALEASRLLNAAASFRRSLPISFGHQLKRQVESELLQIRSVSVIDRMELLEQNIDLSRQVSDEDLSLLVEELGTDVKDLTTETFLRAIQTLGQEEEGRIAQKKQIARFGLNALFKVSQEIIENDYSILLDLLVLILFMQFEEDLSDEFDAAEVFTEIFDQLKDNMILNWLASTTWSHQSPTGPSSENLMMSMDELSKSYRRKFPITQTVLEGIYGYRSCDTPLPRGMKTDLLTYWSRVWLNEVFKGGYASSLEDIMGILLSQKEYRLAFEFSKFVMDSNWGTYLKGRMHLALGEYDLASICFQKAAYNLGVYHKARTLRKQLTSSALGMFGIDEADSLNFIPLDQRDSFSDGLPKYYHHVLGLFEKEKAYSFVSDFARLGLRSLTGGEDADLKTELLSRLFTASKETAKFDEAYSAMTRYTDMSL
jgi:DNA repair protein RAD51/nuclear pore complex protein Nup160